MIFLYSDVLHSAGGVETHLHALALRLEHEKLPFHVVVVEFEPCPLLDQLEDLGIKVYRQRWLPGARWFVRQRFMLNWLRTQLKPGDWVFCVREPISELYLKTVQLVHRRQAKIAVSWCQAPEFVPPAPAYRAKFCQAVAETDAVISISKCTAPQFKEVYGYTGQVHVVRTHNLPLFQAAIPLPPGPPWKIGFIGRIDINQKNLDTLLKALVSVVQEWTNVELHLYGRGPDQAQLEALALSLGIQKYVTFHGAYDHRNDLLQIMSNCHFFVNPSNFEGSPLALLEIMQAGRFCIASRVGGVPDLYNGFPEMGLLVSPNNLSEISQSIVITLEMIASQPFNGDKIRSRYFGEFDIESVHQAWTYALNLNLDNDEPERHKSYANLTKEKYRVSKSEKADSA